MTNSENKKQADKLYSLALEKHYENLDEDTLVVERVGPGRIGEAY